MKTLKQVLAPVAGLVVWLLAFEVIWLAVGAIGRIPVLGSFLYAGDAGWAQIVLSTTTSVFAAAYCSVKICGGAKAFCVVHLVLSAVYLYSFIRAGITDLWLYGALVPGAVCDVICFRMGEKDVSGKGKRDPQ